MRKKTETKYFNFPVSMLSGFLDTPVEVLERIRAYGIYAAIKSATHEQKGPAETGIAVREIFSNYELNPENIFGYLVFADTVFRENSRGGQPMAGISLQVINDYLENPKSSNELVQLLGYLALKSIVGSQKYRKITVRYWVSRMAGFATTNKELPEELAIYLKEYRYKKLKFELVDRWGLVEYSQNVRGFYVSFKLSLDELALEAEKNKLAVKKAIQQNSQAKAQELAKEKLGVDRNDTRARARAQP